MTAHAAVAAPAAKAVAMLSLRGLRKEYRPGQPC